jgi:xanthine dehydrogenase YagS FAD-binding subunit
MVPFNYVRADTRAMAVHTQGRHRSDDRGVDYFAGGTDMMQLMKQRVRNPGQIVDLNGLPGMSDIVADPDGLRLGALVRMSDAARHPVIVKRYPVIAEALLASASPQVRNLATLGGNLLQRTRCGYFRDVVAPCNKRRPGTGCPALDGQNRLHAILGGSLHCIATYASDFANALLVLDATLHVAGKDGERQIALADLHRLPGDTPHIETQLKPGDLILGIEVPASEAALHSHYLKVRDRASFEWSIASVAVALDLDSSRSVRDVRLAVGGVATKPWRLPNVEKFLLGRPLDQEICRQAGRLASDGAVTHGQNRYKIKLIERTVMRGLEETGGLV